MLVLLIVTTVLSVSLGDRTFGDVRQCTADSFSNYKTYCHKDQPGYKDFDKVQQCFEAQMNDFETCLKRQGVFISDSTPCYPMSTSRKHDDGVTSELFNAAGCYKRCIKRAHKRCRRNCTGQPIVSDDERKSKLRECKNDCQILDCSEIPESINNDNNNSNQQTTVGVDPFPTVTYNI